MLKITINIPLETRQYRIPLDVAEQAMDKFENIPIFYDDSKGEVPHNCVVGTASSGKLVGDNIVIDGYLFKDAAIEFLKFDDLHIPASIEICNPKRGSYAED